MPVDSPEEELSDRIGLAEVMDKLDTRRERRILKWMREQLLDAL